MISLPEIFIRRKKNVNNTKVPGKKKITLDMTILILSTTTSVSQENF